MLRRFTNVFEDIFAYHVSFTVHDSRNGDILLVADVEF